MSDKLYFSIILTTHNRSLLISRALNSVRKQDFKLYELIVIDDGSVQSYSNVLNNYKDVITQYHKNEKSCGVSHSRNLGLKLAKGEWVVFLDDDDEFSAGFLSAMYAKIESLPCDNKYFFWTNVRVIHYGNSGRPTHQWIMDYASEKYGKSLQAKASSIGGSYGFTVNRSVVELGIFFDETMSQAEDTEFIIRLMANHYLPEYVNYIGVVKHNHSSARLSQSFDKYSANKVYEKIFNRYKSFFMEFKEVYCSMLQWSALIHYWSGDKKSGDINFRKFMLVDLRNIGRFRKMRDLWVARSACALANKMKSA